VSIRDPRRSLFIVINYLRRKTTKAILVHCLTCLPDSVCRSVDVEAVFRNLGMLSAPVHLIQLPSGEIEDSYRDIRAIGCFDNTIDILQLCSGPAPTEKQQAALHDLIQALLLDDFGEDAKPPEVITVTS